jgi:peptidoglycan hydrolase-like protein with peptidoglycan-binding domain
MAKDRGYEQAKAEFPADFAPRPTVFNDDGDALGRMLKLWNKARDKNTGGYGGNRLFKVKGWGATGTVTSCSPFTATIIGMLFDPDGGVDKDVWEPKYDNGTQPLPYLFYEIHNGDFVKNNKARVRWFDENKWHPTASSYLNIGDGQTGAGWINDSAHSLVWYNLGYEIDPRDMRRGDMVGLNWGNRNGHATFCWDVHLNEQGEVDCWLLVSSNSPGKVGVSVYTWPRTLFLSNDGGKWKSTKTPYFKDDDKFVTNGDWMCLPHLDHTDIKKETFKLWPERISGRGNTGEFAIGNLRVTRFWGFPPPENPHGTLLGDNAVLARKLAKFPAQPEPYCKGTCVKPGGVKPVPAKQVKKDHPEPKKAVAPTQAKQNKAEAVSQQRWVEAALADLFRARWIEKDPGSPDAIADAQSRAAIEDFQARFKIDGEPGHAGPKTRAALQQARSDLEAGKPNPNDKARKPAIEQFYWSPNTVEPGGSVVLGVKGENLDLVASYDVTLSDKRSGASHTASLSITASHGAGSASLAIPPKFIAGSTLGLTLSAAGIEKRSSVPLYIARPAGPRRDWPWDEKAWPVHVQDMVRQLRAAPARRGDVQLRRVTQYGVWDNLSDGDTPVLDRKGRTLGYVDRRSLYLADLEGTMRLEDRILNLVSSGNRFDAMGKASFDTFDPGKSRWIDVSAQAPWGMGAKMPLIPFRTLAHDPRQEALYGRKVFIEPLVGFKLPTGEIHNGVCIVGDSGSMERGQLDLFVGPGSGRIALPAQCNVEIL